MLDEYWILFVIIHDVLPFTEISRKLLLMSVSAVESA